MRAEDESEKQLAVTRNHKEAGSKKDHFISVTGKNNNNYIFLLKKNGLKIFIIIIDLQKIFYLLYKYL